MVIRWESGEDRETELWMRKAKLLVRKVFLNITTDSLLQWV